MDIRDLKLAYGQRAKDEIRYAFGLSGSEDVVRCNSGKHEDKDASMKWRDQVCQWFCYSCSHRLDIFDKLKEVDLMDSKQSIEYLKKETNMTHFEYKKPKSQTFNKPNMETRPLNQEEIAIMARRGITEDTLNF